MKKLKRIICAAFAFLLVGANIGGVLPAVMAADGDDPTVRNPEPVRLPDGDDDPTNDIVLYKTAASDSEYANKWWVTLRVEAPVKVNTSDTVVVIDRSYSMNGSPLTAAKSAATSLVNKLLDEDNVTNRVAIVSFGSDVTTNVGFSNDKTTVLNAISGITTNSNSATFTQGGLHSAISLFADSEATYKNIVLLSDGEPTYSYGINNVDDYLTEDYTYQTFFGGTVNAKQTSSTVAQGDFNYSSSSIVGSGSSLRTCTYSPGFFENCNRYYNHGNSAIAESKFAEGIDIHAVAFNVSEGDTGASILSSIASSPANFHQASTSSELESIFNSIAGKITSLVGNTSVHDEMAEGVIVENAEHTTSVDWKPNFKYDEENNIFWDEYTYEVEANEHILDANSADGFHPLNKDATLTYGDGKVGKFPVPYVKPFFINVAKELEGQECAENECVFDFEIHHPAGERTTYYTVEAGKTHRIVEAFPIGDYVLTETGTNSKNPVKFENYLVSYTGNQFTIAEQHSDHIDVTLNNKYETVDLAATKEWDDDDNRDGLRNDYDDLYVVVKDGNNYVAYEKVDGSDEQSFEFSDLPKNRNGVEIEYSLGEAMGCSESNNVINCRDFVKDNKYESTVNDGVITNKHTPETVKLTIKKKWDTSAGTLPTLTPEFVTVEVSDGQGEVVKEVSLRGTAYDEWVGEFEGYKYENGEEIEYSIREKEIGGVAFKDNEDTLYIYSDEVLEGKWVASYEGNDVTNTWTPAETVYAGEGAFEIEKVDREGNHVRDVTFKVGDNEYTTGDTGKVKVVFSESDEEPSDEYNLRIKEVAAPEFYDMVKGTEILRVKTDLELEVDEESLTNTYTKLFDFQIEAAADGYVWQGDDLNLVVTNQALVNKLEIVKKFSGITAEAFEENSRIEFKITGPEGFDEMTVGIGDEECNFIDDSMVCYIENENVLMPVGDYTVVEQNADIEDFTYEAEPTSGSITKRGNLGKTEKFAFTNTYTPAKTASYRVQKIWEDADDQDGARPDTLEVTLYADGEAYGDPVTLKASEDWYYEWTELPVVNENAEKVEYAVEEEEVAKYESNDGEMRDGVMTFVNTHEPEKVIISVDKSWNDDNNRDGLRTDDSTVTFCVTGMYGDYTSEPECKTVIAGVGLKTDVVVFENLPKYYKGHELSYEVTEVDTLDGYESDLVPGEYVEISDENEGIKNITNTHEPEKLSFLIEKIWDDGDDEDRIRPDEITVIIDGGEEAKILTITKDSSVEDECEEWCVEVTDLVKYSAGEEIEYTISEEEVSSYETEISGSVEDGFTIVNIHTPAPKPVIDPCVDDEGCGMVIISEKTTPFAPDTGGLVVTWDGNMGDESVWMNVAISCMTLALVGVITSLAGKRKEVRSTK